MTRAALFVLSALLVGCAAHPGLERWGERALLAESTAVIACDYGQTTWMAHDGQWDRGLHEGDPVLMTPYPSGAELAGVAAGAEAGLILGYEKLPPKWRWAMLAVVAVGETLNVTTQPKGDQPRPFCGGIL